MTRINKIIMAAIAALALTTASLAIPSQAFAGGGHGHGHGPATDMAITVITGMAIVAITGMAIVTAIAIAGMAITMFTAAGSGPTAVRSISAAVIFDGDDEERLARAEARASCSCFKPISIEHRRYSSRRRIMPP